MKQIIYQVLPRLWGNGRFSAWTKKQFDYLKSLHVDYVWFTGIPRHASGQDFVKGNPGSPYAIQDWMDVNPYLAVHPENRVAEFEALVEKTHKAGLKVITDFIPNHVARNYQGPIPVCDYCDYDWTDTLKIDYSRPETVPALLDVLRFWASKGVDGFRCDMVELVPQDALRLLIAAVKSEFPSVIFIAEVYEKQNYSQYLNYVGFDYLYDKSGAYDVLRGIMAGYKSAREFTWNWQSLSDMQPRMLNFLENHDEQRLASDQFTGSRVRGFAALGAAALFSTAPFMLYFGQELGENASTGAEGRTSIFNFTKVPAIVDLLKGNLSEKQQYVLDRYRSLLDYASMPVFADGRQWDLCYCQGRDFNPDGNFIFARYDDTDAYVVLCNLSDRPAYLDVVIPDDLAALLPGSAKKHGLTVEAGPCDFTVIKL